MAKSKKTRGRYGDGCIYKNGNLFWVKYPEKIVRPDGTIERKTHYKSTGSNDRESAKRFLRDKLHALGGPRPRRAASDKLTYEELRDSFLDHCDAKNLRSLIPDKDASGNGKVTLSTLPLLNSYFGGWLASEITTTQMKLFRERGKTSGKKPRSDKRMNRYIATLSAMFHWSVKDELITGADIPAYFPKTTEPNEAVGAIFIQPQWYAPLRQQLPEPLRSAFTLAYATGIRVVEMQRLRWRDVDLANRTVTLPGAITKTGKPRIVFLPKDFDLPPGKSDDLIFPLGNYQRPWRTACVAVGVGRFELSSSGRKRRYVGPLLRNCRHTAVRNMSDAGMPEKRVMDITGHQTRAMFDRYNLKREDDVAEARQTMEDFHHWQQERSKL